MKKDIVGGSITAFMSVVGVPAILIYYAYHGIAIVDWLFWGAICLFLCSKVRRRKRNVENSTH